MFSLYVDSDSLPVQLRPIILHASQRLSLSVSFVADRPLADIVALATSKQTSIKMIVVEQGADSADNKIVELAQQNDLCITHDIGLANRLLEKGCKVIDDRGSSYTAENIKTLLLRRELNNKLREEGIFAEQQESRNIKTKQLFANNFDRVLTKMLKENN